PAIEWRIETGVVRCAARSRRALLLPGCGRSSLTSNQGCRYEVARKTRRQRHVPGSQPELSGAAGSVRLEPFAAQRLDRRAHWVRCGGDSTELATRSIDSPVVRGQHCRRRRTQTRHTEPLPSLRNHYSTRVTKIGSVAMLRCAPQSEAPLLEP